DFQNLLEIRCLCNAEMLQQILLPPADEVAYNFCKLKPPLKPAAVSSQRPMKTRIARHVAIYALIALTSYGIGACRQHVIINPSEDDLVVLNGCVVSACNYLAAVKTQHALGKNFWANILLFLFFD